MVLQLILYGSSGYVVGEFIEDGSDGWLSWRWMMMMMMMIPSSPIAHELLCYIAF